MVENDYQCGHCHYFADALIRKLRVKLPEQKVDYCLVMANREYEEDGEVLIHAFVQIGNRFIDSEGVHGERQPEVVRVDWEINERYQGVEPDDLNSWVDESEESIPGCYYDESWAPCPVILKKDIRAFLRTKAIKSLIAELV